MPGDLKEGHRGVAIGGGLMAGRERRLDVMDQRRTALAQYQETVPAPGSRDAGRDVAPSSAREKTRLVDEKKEKHTQGSTTRGRRGTLKGTSLRCLAR